MEKQRVITVTGLLPRWSDRRDRNSRGTTVPSRYHMDVMESCACVSSSSTLYIEYRGTGEPDAKYSITNASMAPTSPTLLRRPEFSMVSIAHR